MSGGNSGGTDPSIAIILHDTTPGSAPVTINVPVPSGDLIDPKAVVEGDFNGDGVADFAVLSGNPTNGTNDFVTVFVNTTLPGGPVSFAASAPINLGPGAVAMATGFLTGSTTFNDLAILFNTAGVNDLEELQNTSSSSAISFVPHTIALSVFAGAPIGVAIGSLSTTATNAFQDIAVVYGAGGRTGESMVRVFQNAQISFEFQVTPVPVTGGDYDALQTSPTGITVAALGGTGGTWNSIVVTNNDDGDPRDGTTLFNGTVSVLAPIARPAGVSTVAVSNFVDTVSIPLADVASITDVTVDLEVTDKALADLKIQLVAPDGTTSITLITNQYILVGTTATQTSANVGVTGTSLGIFDYSPGPPTVPGFPVGTVFDDNATNNIVNLNPVGDYGAPDPASYRGSRGGNGLHRALEARVRINQWRESGGLHCGRRSLRRFQWPLDSADYG